MRKCSYCNKTKEDSEFIKRSDKKDLLRSWCRPCSAKIRKNYRNANAEKVAAQRLKYYREHPDKYKAYSKAWQQSNPGKQCAIVAKRHAAKIQRTPKWLTGIYLQQIEMFYDAASRLTKEFGIAMEVDHIIPLQGNNVSGLHVPWNLQVISEKENSQKGNRHE